MENMTSNKNNVLVSVIITTFYRKTFIYYNLLHEAAVLKIAKSI